MAVAGNDNGSQSTKVLRRNVGIIRAMEVKLRKPVLVPDKLQIVAALGAALVAQQG